MVSLHSLTKRFGSTLAVDQVDLEIQRGEFFALLGPSGSGKTTLLGLIAGFHEPSAGSVVIEGTNVTSVPSHKRNLAMMFQNYALFPHLNVFYNVGFGLRMRGVPKTKIKERVMKELVLVRLEGFEDRWPNQLSGGQQQRVALARALVVEPKVLLLDEPLAALDKGLRDEMRVELKEIQRNSGITTIFVTHDQGEALSLSDRVAIMDQGRIIQVDSPHQIHANPKNSFVARFLGLQNVFSGKLIQKEKDLVWVESDDGKNRWVAIYHSDEYSKKCNFYIRPERIHIVDQTLKTGFNYLSGRAREINYLGVYTEIRVELTSGTQLVVYDMGNSEMPILESGSKINLYIDPKDVVII
jgi:spermidine/putrescine ABC transporter ATP-binding subunit